MVVNVIRNWDTAVITPTSSATPTASSDSDKKQVPLGAIVGSVLGDVVVVVVGILFFLSWRKRKGKKGGYAQSGGYLRVFLSPSASISLTHFTYYSNCNRPVPCCRTIPRRAGP